MTKAKKAKETKKPICYVCGQSGYGPLEQSQDGSGYRHSYGCSNTTGPVNHHGQPCILRAGKLCQEGYCSNCEIELRSADQ